MDGWDGGREEDHMAHGINTTAGTRKESRLKGSCILESASREVTVMSQRALLTTILQVRHCNPQARWPFCPLRPPPFGPTTVTNRGTLKTFCLMFLTGGHKQRAKYACVDYS